jgi:glyoxylase-like metal-dependent hydrolase (beta-lactamase superfamily II)
MAKESQIILPASTSTVTVRAIDTTTKLLCAVEGFVRPQIPGHSVLNLPTLAFLIEHVSGSDGSKQSILFDCGARKDWWNFAPKIKQRLNLRVRGLHIEKGIDEVLHDAQKDPNDIKALLWSHWHWDHCGDATLFPPHTEIVVGPGFKENFLPGYPIDPESPMLQADFESVFLPLFGWVAILCINIKISEVAQYEK